ncbi:MAG: hypothetical protein JWO39_484 [Gemmatimonadetes bacterium]|nr:hypothetical protein [Gemmatimonadota bacterium]
MMKRDAIYGSALIASALSGLVTMSMHPTGNQLLADVQHVAPIGLAVHALALVALPVSFFGTIGLTRLLGADGDAPLAALAGLVAYGMAQIAVMIAAVASGLLAPALAAHMVATTGAEHDVAAALFSYTGAINQAFAKVYVIASSAAILLWSCAILAHGRLSRAAGMLGALVGVLALLAVTIGHLRLDVHGFGAVVLSQGIWMITVGVLLARSAPEQAQAGL